MMARPPICLHSFQLVGDEEHRDTAGLEAGDDLDQIVDLLPRERGGRLIHDDETRLGGDGARDGHQLARGERQRVGAAHEEGAVGRQMHIGKRPARRGVQRRKVEPACEMPGGGHQLFAEGDILDDREIGQKRQVLVDGLDPGGERADGTEIAGNCAGRLAIDEDLAFIRRLGAGKNLDQGRLAAAILPHQVVDLAGLDHQAHLLQRADAAEGFLDVSDLEEGRFSRRFEGRDGRHRTFLTEWTRRSKEGCGHGERSAVPGRVLERVVLVVGLIDIHPGLTLHDDALARTLGDGHLVVAVDAEIHAVLDLLGP